MWVSHIIFDIDTNYITDLTTNLKLQNWLLVEKSNTDSTCLWNPKKFERVIYKKLLSVWGQWEKLPDAKGHKGT